MSKLIDDVSEEEIKHIPLHFLSTTKSEASDFDMVSFFGYDELKVEKIGTDYKLFNFFNKPIFKYKQ